MIKMHRRYTSPMPDREVRTYFPKEFWTPFRWFMTLAKPFNNFYGSRDIQVNNLFGSAKVTIRENRDTGKVSYKISGSCWNVRRARSRLGKLLRVELTKGAEKQRSTPRNWTK